MNTLKHRYIRETRPVGLECITPSKTKQSFAKEADINTIMRRYQKTGVLVDPNDIKGNRKPMFDDFSSGQDFQAVQDQIAHTHQEFELLPAHIRAQFGNSPSNLLDAMADPANEEALREMGILPPVRPTEETSEVVVEPTLETSTTEPLEAQPIPEKESE